jgi:L-ascorbate metabolism protein UlaG (beta-lactamase superfamily)
VYSARVDARSPFPRQRRGPLAALRALLRTLRGGPGHRGPVTDHFDGRQFFNQAAAAGRSFADFWRWQRTRRPKRWPPHVPNTALSALPAALPDGDVALTFINHVTFLIQVGELNILTDPVFSQRASPLSWLGPERVRPPGLPFDQLPDIDLVLVSHNHYDHMDVPTLRRLDRAHAPLFVTGLGNRGFLVGEGLRRVIELDWWQQSDYRRARVVFTPAQHWSSRGPGRRNHTLWGGFLIQAAGRQIYFAADTGYASHFYDLWQRHGAVDVALLPIGAYEPRWFMEEQHMNPEEAVRAHLDLHARLSIGMHYGCFQLTDEGFEEPEIDLDHARRRLGVSPQAFRTLEVGETLQMGR